MKWLGRLVMMSVMLACSMISAVVYAQMQGGAPGYGGITDKKADSKGHWACWNEPGGSFPAEVVSYYNWWQGYGKYITGLDLRYYIPNACHPLDDMLMDDNLIGAYGWTYCNQGTLDPVDGYICLEAVVRISQAAHQSRANQIYWNYSEGAYQTWCHEIGHSYGIWHNYHSGSCTSSGDPFPGLPTDYSWGEYTLMQTYLPLVY